MTTALVLYACMAAYVFGHLRGGDERDPRHWVRETPFLLVATVLSALLWPGMYLVSAWKWARTARGA